MRTAELTKAFGWDRDEVFVQHDVQVSTEYFMRLMWVFFFKTLTKKHSRMFDCASHESMILS